MTAPTGTIHIPSNGICEENRDSKMHVLAHNASCKSYKSYKSGGGGGGLHFMEESARRCPKKMAFLIKEGPSLKLTHS